MKQFYEEEAGVIINADCREILPELSATDLCFTDPPYNVGKDYGNWNDALPDDEYLAFCRSWIKQSRSVARAMVVYAPTKYLLDYWNMFGPEYRQIILTWTPEGAYRNGFVNQFASLLTNAKPTIRTKDVWPGLQMRGMGYFFKENDYGHPGYTSEDITRKVISSFTIPGDTVLDCFLGSGTTAVCAKKLGRKFIGIEISEKYCQIAVERLRQSVMKLEVK